MYGVRDAAVDDVAPGREAHLALELERGEGAGRGRGLEVGVVEDDERVVAAELERDALEPLPGERADPPAGRGRAGERDRVDVGVGDDRLADLGVAEDDVEQALGQAGLAEHRLEHRPAADRRLRVGLEDHRVAERRAPAPTTRIPSTRRRVPRA